MKTGRIKKKKSEKVKKFYSLYTSGLSRNEIEQLLKKDAVEAYSYLKSKTDIDESPESPSRRSVPYIIKEIFISFLMQLTPARRLFYGLAIVGFVAGLVKPDNAWLIVSFLIMNILVALELVDKLTTRDELEIAREIQMGLQPDHIPRFRMLSIAAFSKPAKVVGGDFFDVVNPGKNMVVSIVGDVSGKGISAALYAAYIQSMFQSLSESKTSPAELMKTLNELISKRLRDGHFITAVIAIFDLDEKNVTIARAGHNWPLYYSANENSITELKPRGLGIGLYDNDQFADLLEEQTIKLHEGDFLLFYSDGITEAANSKNVMFDISGLKTAVMQSIHESSEDIVNRINTNLNEFMKSKDLHDDATLLAIKID